MNELLFINSITICIIQVKCFIRYYRSNKYLIALCIRFRLTSCRNSPEKQRKRRKRKRSRICDFLFRHKRRVCVYVPFGGLVRLTYAPNTPKIFGAPEKRRCIFWEKKQPAFKAWFSLFCENPQTAQRCDVVERKCLNTHT